MQLSEQLSKEVVSVTEDEKETTERRGAEADAQTESKNAEDVMTEDTEFEQLVKKRETVSVYKAEKVFCDIEEKAATGDCLSCVDFNAKIIFNNCKVSVVLLVNWMHSATNCNP